MESQPRLVRHGGGAEMSAVGMLDLVPGIIGLPKSFNVFSSVSVYKTRL